MGDNPRMKTSETLYKRQRFPAEIISYAVWLYHRFNLSHSRGVGPFIEDLLAYRDPPLCIMLEIVRIPRAAATRPDRSTLKAVWVRVSKLVAISARKVAVSSNLFIHTIISINTSFLVSVGACCGDVRALKAQPE
jgi:hypothetical protein